LHGKIERRRKKASHDKKKLPYFTRFTVLLLAMG
jgi:hypothetical protein